MSTPIPPPVRGGGGGGMSMGSGGGMGGGGGGGGGGMMNDFSSSNSGYLGYNEAPRYGYFNTIFITVFVIFITALITIHFLS